MKFDQDNLTVSTIVRAFHEAAGAGKSAQSAAIQPSGFMRIRRAIEVSAFLQRILSAMIADTPEIEVDGIRIYRPADIQIRMTGFRQWSMTPAFPVSVSVMGTQVSVDVSNVQLTTDPELGFPAIMITTASALKPDIMLILEGRQEDEESQEDAPEPEEVATLIARYKVPQKYQLQVMNAVKYAWGPKQLAPARMKAITGTVTQDSADGMAKEIVNDLMDHQVVSGGLFFWMQLGYWLIRIISALIKARRS